MDKLKGVTVAALLGNTLLKTVNEAKDLPCSTGLLSVDTPNHLPKLLVNLVNSRHCLQTINFLVRKGGEESVKASNLLSDVRVEKVKPSELKRSSSASTNEKLADAKCTFLASPRYTMLSTTGCKLTASTTAQPVIIKPPRLV